MTEAPSSNQRRKPRGADLGARLRTAREAKKVGVRELARRIGVSHSLISQIETGRSEPSISTLFAIVGELEIPVNEIVWDSLEGPHSRLTTSDPGTGEDGAPRDLRSRRDGSTGMVSPVQGPYSRRSIQLESASPSPMGETSRSTSRSPHATHCWG